MAKNGLKPEEKGAKIRRFAGFIPVKTTNHLRIIATDINGNTTTRNMTVVYHEPDYLEEKYRLRAALFPFYSDTQIPWINMTQLSSLISKNITQPPVRFLLLARGSDMDTYPDRTENQPISIA